MGATSFVNVTSVSRSAAAALAGMATSPAAASKAPANSILAGPDVIHSRATASGLSLEIPNSSAIAPPVKAQPAAGAGTQSSREWW